MLASAIFMLPWLFETLGRMQRFAMTHPDQATVTTGPGSYQVTIQGDHPELMPDLHGIVIPLEIITGIAIIMLAAAVARRLHDRGLTGWLGLVPVPFLCISLALTPDAFTADPTANLPRFFALFASNFIYVASGFLLIALMAMPTKPGPNRYGDPPTD